MVVRLALAAGVVARTSDLARVLGGTGWDGPGVAGSGTSCTTIGRGSRELAGGCSASALAAASACAAACAMTPLRPIVTEALTPAARIRPAAAGCRRRRRGLRSSVIEAVVPSPTGRALAAAE